METLIAERAQGAVLNFLQWRFRFKRSLTQDAVYVVSYTRKASALAYGWEYGNFWAMSVQSFESYKAHFKTAEFIEVEPGQNLIEAVPCLTAT